MRRAAGAPRVRSGAEPPPPGLQPAVPLADGSADSLEVSVVAKAGLDAELLLLRASLGRRCCLRDRRGSEAVRAGIPGLLTQLRARTHS